ncbi:TPA: DUF6404 family protein [Photobacterium damselae]|uniref:Uncharacterized protein n=2 Tax=Photobacterium damselae TaxID=38293 RepID=A0A1V1VAY6_PHODP|nr:MULTISPECIES: DUF6404 family protein [Gammaproteobacteria]ELI6447438.1 hypothetical protein [Photobacterium damselae]ELV7516032.1 hypothetical protein [Photobacterium damselae]MBE8129602.1 hypothetical protein [Photobacterium damselae subsp. piscicida]MCG3810601.1 hypothetical protein [Psychrobacter sp. Ps4]MCG3844069.1 hypothetical protein [Photobacterium damselae]
MDAHYQQRLNAAFRQLQGVRITNYDPIVDRLFRRVGIYLPPSYYRHPLSNLAIFGVMYWPLFFVLNILFVPVASAALYSLIPSLLLSSLLTVYFYWTQCINDLTEWQQLDL